jgi:FkbM family methyltransferase
MPAMHFSRKTGLLGSVLPTIIRRGWKLSLARRAAYKLGELLGARHRVVIGRLPSGSQMALAVEDHQHREIYFRGEYETELTNLFRRLLVPGSVVLDVGANAGYFTFLSRDLGAEVSAFEPNPALLKLLRRSREFDPQSITIVPAACSNHIGSMELFIADSSNTGMSSLNRRSEISVMVDVLTLDRYCKENDLTPTLIKIDAEGHEREVLTGARTLLETARPIIVVETGHAEVFELLDRHGYVGHGVAADGSLRPPDRQHDFSENYLNLCFMPSPQDIGTT